MVPVAQAGCISQVQSSFPFGCHALDCNQDIDRIMENGIQPLGRMCVGQGGVDACDFPIAVEPATWGRIKATYN